MNSSSIATGTNSAGGRHSRTTQRNGKNSGDTIDSEWQQPVETEIETGKPHNQIVSIKNVDVARQHAKEKGLTAPTVHDPFPYSTERPIERNVLSWIRGERVVVWLVALLLGQAITRIVASLTEDVIEPMFNRAFNDPDNERPAINILGAKIRFRHFVMAIFQFVLIIAIAYALSDNGRYDPAYYQNH